MKSNKWTRRQFNKTTSAASLFAMIQGFLSFSLKAQADDLERVAKDNLEDGKTYDYIVVGAGAAGALVSARLARAGFSVLTLDAGSAARNNNYEIPILSNNAAEDPEYAWNFFVKHYEERQKHGNVWDDEKNGILYPRSAAIGGCTVHNALVTIYPQYEDFKNWAQMSQDDSYKNTTEMYRLFNKVREWLPIEQSNPLLGIKDAQIVDNLFSAFREAGLPQSPIEQFENFVQTSEDGLIVDALDPNSQSNLNTVAGDNNLFLIPQSSKNGKRAGVREYLLRTAKSFPGLVVGINCFVKNILLENSPKDGLVAKGVEFWQQPHIYGADPNQQALKPGTKKAFARHDVIIAGGAFNTPQILMQSGIGDPDHLKQHGINCVLPRLGVGRNLQDRYEMTVVTQHEKNFSVTDKCTYTLEKDSDPCYKTYLEKPRSSPYSSNGILVGITKRSQAKMDRASGSPDLFIFGAPGKFRGYYRNWSKKTTNAKNTFTWAILKAHTNNRSGFVKLKSNSPLDPPEINFKYFEDSSETHKADLDAVVEGIEFVREINKNIHPLSSDRHEIFPGQLIQTKEELRYATRQNSWGHHASCTAKMGNPRDPQAVVDSNFRVIGTQNLRVVDASIFDRIPGYFIVLPIYMMAEKASELFIKEKRGAK